MIPSPRRGEDMRMRASYCPHEQVSAWNELMGIKNGGRIELLSIHLETINLIIQSIE
jgi:hypothetical protein